MSVLFLLCIPVFSPFKGSTVFDELAVFSPVPAPLLGLLLYTSICSNFTSLVLLNDFSLSSIYLFEIDEGVFLTSVLSSLVKPVASIVALALLFGLLSLESPLFIKPR